MTFIEKWDLVIDAWMTRVVNEQNKHERLAIKSMRLHYGLGIPSVSIAAISGTSVLIEMATASLAAKVVVGLSGNDHRIGSHREAPGAACRSSKRGPPQHDLRFRFRELFQKRRVGRGC